MSDDRRIRIETKVPPGVGETTVKTRVEDLAEPFALTIPQGFVGKVTLIIEPADPSDSGDEDLPPTSPAPQALAA